MIPAADPLRKIVSVNTADRGGGAERVAWQLFQAYQKRGLESWLAVGQKQTGDPHVMSFWHSPHINYRIYHGPYEIGLRWARAWDRMRGREDFRYPYSRHVLQMTGSPPQVVHLHNLHGGYFDLRALPSITRRAATWLTLHDCWTFTGHCAYPHDCSRWERSCGQCPFLSTPPALERDGTRANLLCKRRIYQRSRLRIAAGSRWLLDQAHRSVLAPAIIESRMIPYGVDPDIFRPHDRAAARAKLGIPRDAVVLLFVAQLARSNPFKDYATVRAAAGIVAEQSPRSVHLYCIGEAGPTEHHGRLRLHHLPFESEPAVLATYYQAADVYLHAARIEVFGIVIAEAMACGLPVVATRVGGIPEVFSDGGEGFLTPAGDPAAMAERASWLLEHPEQRQAMGERAAALARRRYDQERMVDAYLDWIRSTLDRPSAKAA